MVKGETCCSQPCGGSATVSPLCGSSRQGAMAVGALCLPSCPLRLPLLFPKSSSILFGSPVCARQVPQGEAMYSRSVFGTAHRSIQDPSARSLVSLAPSIGMTERKGNRVDASRMRRTNGYTQSNVCSRFPDGLPFAIFNASKILHSTFYIYHSKREPSMRTAAPCSLRMTGRGFFDAV